jgi:hypothetical protein
MAEQKAKRFWAVNLRLGGMGLGIRFGFACDSSVCMYNPHIPYNTPNIPYNHPNIPYGGFFHF